MDFAAILMINFQPIKKAEIKILFRYFTPTIDIEPKKNIHTSTMNIRPLKLLDTLLDNIKA